MIESGLINIPVLGSGDMFSPLDVKKFLTFTKTSGVIIAWGAIHNPQIFKFKEQMIGFDEITNQSIERWTENCEVTTISSDKEEVKTREKK